MELFFQVFISIIVTAFAYLAFPLSFCVRKKRLTQRQIKKIVILNGLIVWLVFAVIAINSGGKPSAAVFLYSSIAYFALKKKCLYVPKPCDSKGYTPKYNATETVRVQLARDNEKNYGNYNGKLKDLELKPETPPTIEEKEKPSDDGKLTEGRKQLVNLAMNVPEDKVELALKLLRTLN